MTDQNHDSGLEKALRRAVGVPDQDDREPAPEGEPVALNSPRLEQMIANQLHTPN